MISANENERKESGDSMVRIKMFGIFDITYKDMSIFLENGGNLKPLNLLCFMLSQREKTFIAESISENVWPGNEYIDGKKVIRTYIHRIRKLLASENVFHKDFSNDINIINVKGNYKIEVSENVYFDIDYFESLGKKASEEKDVDKLIQIYDDLTSFYNGEFLENYRLDYWVVMFRNYYIRSFCQIANNILNKIDETKNFQKMSEICESALKIYSLDESINIHYIKALMYADDVAGALKHYTYITQRMYNELSVSPSSKMLEIYSIIKSAKNAAAGAESGILGTLDNQSLWIMINDAVRNHLNADLNKYSIGHITIVGSNLAQTDDEDGTEDSHNLKEVLKSSLEFALRKNDMYSIIDDTTSIVILYDAKEDYYENICNRISEAFYKRLDSFNFILKIKIHTVNKIN